MMVTKRCAYRGCNSYICPTHPCAETFYAFPKDPERCKLWLELGACSKNIPPTMRYFCSKHFDETKYVAHNQRRKQLLSSAIPWPYQQIQQKPETIQHEVDYQCVESTIDDNDDDEEDTSLERYDAEAVSVEVTDDLSNEMSEEIDDAVLQSYEFREVSPGTCELNIGLSSDRRPLKRKPESLIKQPLPSSNDVQVLPQRNRASSSTSLITIQGKPVSKVKIVEEIEENRLLESTNLTTFIYKGQEYIQMPKDEYTHEKQSLLQKIKMYEAVFKNMKQLMDDVVP